MNIQYTGIGKIDLSKRHGDDTEEISGDALVVCLGAGSYHIAILLGDRVNIYPIKGYSITVHLNDAFDFNDL